jgi:PAS domain S-box-containing protein
MRVRVLLVDHVESDAVLVRDALWACRYDVTHCGQLATGLAQLEAEPVDAMLAALHLPDADGVEVVHRVRGVARHLPLVVVSGPDDEDIALAAVRSGAQDAVPKAGLDATLIERSLRYACQRARLEAELRDAEARLRLIEDRVPVVICNLAPDGTVTGLNPEFHAMTGWSPGECTGREFGALLHPEDRAAALELVRAARRAESLPPLDVRVRDRQFQRRPGRDAGPGDRDRGDRARRDGAATAPGAGAGRGADRPPHGAGQPSRVRRGDRARGGTGDAGEHLGGVRAVRPRPLQGGERYPRPPRG